MEMFLKTLMNMSLMASIVILVIIVVRWLFAWLRVPKKYMYLLWLLPFIRLLCPLSLESGLSLLPDTNRLVEYAVNGWQMLSRTDEDTTASQWGQVQSDTLGHDGEAVKNSVDGSNQVDSSQQDMEKVTGVVDQNAVSSQSGNDESGKVASEAPEHAGHVDWWWVLGGIWLAGFLGMLFYSMLSYRKLKAKLNVSYLVRDNIYLADGIEAAFVAGYLRPVIYLPSGISEHDMEYVIAHEKVHIARRDHLLKALAFFAVTLHWFNPLCLIAFALFGKDMEMSCDEAVIGKMNTEDRKAYANVLLKMATGNMQFAGMPLTFAEGDPKNRIKNIVKYKKPMVAVSVLAVVVIAGLAVAFLTSPKKEEDGGAPNQQTGKGTSEQETSEQNTSKQETSEQETSEEEASVYIYDPEKSPDDLPFGEVMITAPIVAADPDGTWGYDCMGADAVTLIYASPDYAVGWGYMGLFVYSVQEKKLTGAVNVQVIGCDMTQGDEYTDVFVADEGRTVYMHNITKDYMFAYDILDNTLEKQPYVAGEDGRPKDLQVVDDRQDMYEIMGNQDPDIWVSSECQIFTVNQGQKDEKKCLAYLASGSGELSALSYCIAEWNEEKEGWSSLDGAIWCPYTEASYPFFDGEEENLLWEFTEDSQMYLGKIAHLSASGLTLGIYNRSEQEIMYGDEYHLYRYANDGDLEELEYIQDIAFNDVGHIIKPQGAVAVSIDWSNIYGVLPKEESTRYRLVKKIYVPEEVLLSVEFVFPEEQ